MEITVIILVCVVLLQNITHYFEKKELFKFIKSKNLQEYNGDDSPPHRGKPAYAKVLEDWRKPKGGGSE